MSNHAKSQTNSDTTQTEHTLNKTERSFKWIHEKCRSCGDGIGSLEAYLAYASFLSDNYEDTITYCEIVLKSHPDDKRTLWAYWWSLDEVDSVKDAIGVAEQLYNVDASTPELEYNLGYQFDVSPILHW